MKLAMQYANLTKTDDGFLQRRETSRASSVESWNRMVHTMLSARQRALFYMKEMTRSSPSPSGVKSITGLKH